MNLNEVEKHVKFDLIFSLLLVIGFVIMLLLSVIYLFSPLNAKALSETDMSNGIQAGSHCSSHPNGSICTSQIYSSGSGNPCGNGDSWCVTYNSVIVDNLVMSMNFYLPTALGPDTKNTITLTGNYFSSGNYSCNSTHFNCDAIRVSSNKINVNFNSTSSVVTNAEFFVTKANGSSINDNSHFFRINHVALFTNPQDSDDSSGGGSSFDDTGIINNANQNTTDIINNNNSNTQEIINNINNQLGNLCPNLLNIADFYQKSPSLNLNPTPNNLMLSSSSDWSNVVYRIPVESGKTYYFKGSFTSAVRNQVFLSMSYNVDNLVNTRFWNYEPYSDILGPQVGSWSTSFVSDRTGYVYLGIWVTKGDTNGNNASYFEMMFDTDNKPFCAFGSYSSKLDNLEDLQKQQNDYLMDDTNPSVNTGDIDNLINNVPVQDPLNYLLTLPLNLLTKLNTVISSGTCNRASFGTLYGTELYLPCINFENYLGSDLWGTIDTIVGIGLLAIILKRFYDTISNILSLGKEEEVRKGMELPTPMEFFAQILGGGK